MSSILTASVTPAEYAKARGISGDKVLGWIASGELVAVNVAQSANGRRPRWRISLDAIEAFERSRSTVAKPPAKPKRRCPQTVKQYV